MPSFLVPYDVYYFPVEGYGNTKHLKTYTSLDIYSYYCYSDDLYSN